MHYLYTVVSKTQEMFTNGLSRTKKGVVKIIFSGGIGQAWF